MTETTATDEAPSTHEVENLRESAPIVLEYKAKKKKKKKRYSRGARDLQEMEGQMSKVAKRITRAMAEGTATYDKERNRSARKKRDGAVRDLIPNLGEALSVTADELSGLPSDVAKIMDTKGSRRILRRQLRMLADPLDIWRI